MQCPDENTLVAFAHRLLEVAPAAAVEVHLRTCSECRQVVALLAGACSTSAEQEGPDASLLSEEASIGSVLPERLLPPGTPVGRYLLLKPLGAGGMGVVYAAYDPELTRTVALKLLRGAQVSSEEARTRLQREARAMARLTSPYVLPVHDVGTWRGQVFIAMEWVEGGTLTQWLAERPRDWRQVCSLFLKAGRGLAAAHAAGLVHRDFKPDNVLVGEDGRVRVTDFGLARSVERAELLPEARGSDRESPVALGLTRHGALVGTPAYMSPEQRAGRPVDARSDQFSFCVALYEGLYGERPSPERSLEAPGVPGWLRRVVLRGLNPEPEQRFASMEALLEALEADPALHHRRWGLLASLMLLVLAAVAITHQLNVQRARLCQNGERQLEGIWDASTRHAVETLFLATGRPEATDAWRNVAASLDRYAVEWVGAHTEACEATRLRGEQSEQALTWRMDCLERRRWELEALTGLLRDTDMELPGQALQAAQGLPTLETCADVEALRARPLLPEGAPQRSRARDLLQRMARLRMLAELGRSARGLELAPPVLEEARALGFAPLKAEALLRMGQLQLRAGRTEDGKKLLLDAVLAAHAASRPELAAEGYLELTAATQQPEESLRWARFASAFITASGNAPRLRARLRDPTGQRLEPPAPGPRH